MDVIDGNFNKSDTDIIENLGRYCYPISMNNRKRSSNRNLGRAHITLAGNSGTHLVGGAVAAEIFRLDGKNNGSVRLQRSRYRKGNGRALLRCRPYLHAIQIIN